MCSGGGSKPGALVAAWFAGAWDCLALGLLSCRVCGGLGLLGLGTAGFAGAFWAALDNFFLPYYYYRGRIKIDNKIEDEKDTL